MLSRHLTIYPNDEGDDFVLFLGTPRGLRLKRLIPKHKCSPKKFRLVIINPEQLFNSLGLHIHENISNEEISNFVDELYRLQTQDEKIKKRSETL